MASENLDYHYLQRFVKLGLMGMWPEGAGTLTIVCFTGTTPQDEGAVSLTRLNDNPNKPDEYNDTTILARRNPKTGKGEIYVARGTTEPGIYYTESAEAHPQGAAHLCEGQHPMEPHKRIKDSRLVLQGVGGRTRFWRDRKNQGTRYAQDVDEIPRSDAIGQWWHAMGTGETVGKHSAGCVGPRGGWDGEAWKTFLAWLKDHPKGKPVILTLWNFADYCDFSIAARHTYGPIRFDPTLRMGIRDLTDYGPVHRLQELLRNSHHNPGGIDGDWMVRTQNAFIEFQEANALKPDGICGKESWRKLKTLTPGG